MAGAQSIADSDRTGRLGVMYVRSLLAQAGVANTEFSPGEDYLSIDGTVNFPAGSVMVQVKAGIQKPNKNGDIIVKVTDGWKKKWAKQRLPVFLVYVHLGKTEPGEWVEHDHESVRTIIHAMALWARVNTVKGNSVRLRAEDRLTAETFDAWADEFERAWGEAARA